MLNRDRGDVVFECDGCGEVLETHTSNWFAAKNVLDREGWRASWRAKLDANGEVWEHYCDRCGG